MTKQEVIQWLRRRGFSIDRWGHYQKTTTNGTYRFHLSGTMARYEKQITIPAGRYSPKEHAWLRLKSGYYSKLRLSSEDKLIGMKAGW